MPRERFVDGCHVHKGNETGRVVSRYSDRTDRYYLTVKILTGPRKDQFEFPERGWSLDEVGHSSNERPAHEPDDYVGGEDWKTRHHNR